MQRYAFKMFLNPGMRAEYQRRHDDIWPELVVLLKNAGISNYSIFLDEQTDVLFAYLERGDEHTMTDLPRDPVMQKWWSHMRDIMKYNGDGTPVAIAIDELFHMP